MTPKEKEELTEVIDNALFWFTFKAVIAICLYSFFTNAC